MAELVCCVFQGRNAVVCSAIDGSLVGAVQPYCRGARVGRRLYALAL